ncbi:TRAP transporter permease [Aquisalimonas asiatica]|uniref:TRAP transporter, 4TM/12TM fusion protein n=1 Tax=Aquisalimonas asiatica TaxID=406100 RepID=A0A1H8RG38_9GAMM|nr:TRAP transporter fused permease subunit [Aquisalimonas asiatica]SEO65385.1 TRAP transporter, 4TM/12TM fusion protein [Aquisalimonas asiatica]
MTTSDTRVTGPADDADAEIPLADNERDLHGAVGWAVFGFAVAFVALHLLTLNLAPMETWTYRIIHVAGGLMLGFCTLAAVALARDDRGTGAGPVVWLVALPAVVAVAYAAGLVAWAWYITAWAGDMAPQWALDQAAMALPAGTLIAMAAARWWTGGGRAPGWPDAVLALAAAVVAAYLILGIDGWRMRAGTPMAGTTEMLMAGTGVLLILELTRRVAGWALVVITAVFLVYAFGGAYLPGILEHRGYSPERFFSYIYTDNGILGPTTAVSSTYIILFITFAAFLQASKVGDYFVNFAFAAAGRARGGPAKVAVFASGLMGMINGTSAGNVAATGSLTIPLMKRVGYRARSAGGVEAAASTGGQLVPPIMGAGAFIMAEITGVPYTEIAVAAIIPAALYFLSIYFMVDFEARREGMTGLSGDQLPSFRGMVRQAYLFIPIIILIATLFAGYSVIRAGTLAMVSAVVVSWLTPHWMGVPAILRALALGARMAVPLIAVCACAGIIVGVISLTGVGARFAAMLLQVAEASQLLAMVFAMCISILLGMGMPTTAAYAVAASVVAPGLQQMGIPPLVSHFFVFYFAVLSAITPPVALAAYAAAGIAGTDPLKTATTSFKFGLAAFIVPFMFFYSPALLMEGEPLQIVRVVATASLGVFLLAASLQGWLIGATAMWLRVLLMAGALMMIAGGWLTDMTGIVLALALVALQWSRKGSVSGTDTQVESNNTHSRI